ncbi:hypothetical protein [Microbispora sp. H10830]|nr:hypothetical protein [Microbispora sp. H10830]
MRLVAARARPRQTVDKADIYAQAGLGLPVRDGWRAETVAPPRT